MAQLAYTSVLITTPGGSSSNSFDTLEGLDATLASAPFDTSSWDDLTDEQKDQIAIFGALAFNFLPLRGWRVYTNQALASPRTYQDDLTIVPQAFKTAQAYACFLGVKPAMAKIETEAGSIGKAEVKSVSLEGLVSMTFASDVLQRQGSTGETSLIRLMLSREFPIWFLLSPHLHGGLRSFGTQTRPDLLDEITED